MTANRSILVRINKRFAEVARRSVREDGGSVRLLGSGNPQGWIVSVTNNAVTGNGRSLRCLRRLAELFAQANAEIADSLILGWWRDERGRLFVDLGVATSDRYCALAVGRTFKQQAVAQLKRHRVRIVDCRLRPRPRVQSNRLKTKRR
ncbi:MAG: hypothetical protein AB7N70_35135 [Dehalococcoidia bacterium]